jgi:hypothetical protein
VARGGPSRAWQCGHRLSHRRYMLPVPARHHWRCSACMLLLLAARRGGAARRASRRTPLIKWQSTDGLHSLNPPMHPK